jgi:REP element-mobilizing transposase RayT
MLTAFPHTKAQRMEDEITRPERKPHRLPVLAYTRSEHSYFFTLCARQHGTPFLLSGLAETILDALKWTRERYRWAVYAYCLMPDHLHFLCRPLEPIQGMVNGGARGELPESVLDHVARFKSFTTHRAWRCGIVGPLWQRSSYDVITDEIRREEDMAQYILENPVRKGLVTTWMDWQYSGILDPW